MRKTVLLRQLYEVRNCLEESRYKQGYQSFLTHIENNTRSEWLRKGVLDRYYKSINTAGWDVGFARGNEQAYRDACRLLDGKDLWSFLP